MLAEERKALATGAANQIAQLAAEKSALATRLAELESQRDAALKAIGFAPGQEGIDSWLKMQPAVSTTAWQNVLALVLQARQANETNGMLIGAQMQQNQQALAVLIGESATTYDADGQQKSTASRRPLGSA